MERPGIRAGKNRFAIFGALRLRLARACCSGAAFSRCDFGLRCAREKEERVGGVRPCASLRSQPLPSPSSCDTGTVSWPSRSVVQARPGNEIRHHGVHCFPRLLARMRSWFKRACWFRVAFPWCMAMRACPLGLTGRALYRRAALTPALLAARSMARSSDSSGKLMRRAKET